MSGVRSEARTLGFNLINYLVLSSEAALGDHGSKRNRQILPRARASAPATAALILPLRTALPSPASRWSALVRGNNTPVVPR